jgi:polysaccharide export outer membrane protein
MRGRTFASLRLTGRRLASGAGLSLCLLPVCQAALSVSVSARQSPSPADGRPATQAAQQETPPADQAADSVYLIGPNDVLDIRVFNKPILSRDNVRVDARGAIRMPLIEGEIQAACRTEHELAKVIAKGYLKYQRNPQVDVFVKEYNSQPAMVIGAVNTPGQFKLQRRVRLLELLALAGGPAERAGRNVHVIHAADSFVCGAAPEPLADGQAEAANVNAYNLGDILRGDASANPLVRAGDVITLPNADQVYVVGNVIRPAALALREPLTVTQAIASAGGVGPEAKKEKVRISRQPRAGGAKTEIVVDLNAIARKKAEDVLLEPNDIVEVPTAGINIFKQIVGTIVPTLTRLPTTVVR